MPFPLAKAVAAIVAIALASACVAAVARNGPNGADGPVQIAPGAFSLEVLEETVRTLSSDAFEGRAIGTAGEEKTIRYLVERFAAAGLQPGNGTSWLQPVPMVEVTGQDYGPLIVEAGDRNLRFDFGTDWVGVSARPAKKVDIEASEIVFVGYGINAPELGWNDYAGIDMRGKTALILVNDPDHAMKSTKGPFGGRAMSYYGRWTYKFEEAARQGAMAALIVHEPIPAAHDWDAVEGGWTGPQILLDPAQSETDPTLVNGWVRVPAAQRMLDAAGKDLATLTAAAQKRGFRAAPLGITMTTGFENSVRRFTSHNIVGILRGHSRPDEYVLYTSHWDHLGRCPADETGDDICNGAIDNATGVAALVALAAANKAAGPAARSQVFIALTGEEEGLLGSEFYATHPIYLLSQTAGGINIDTMMPSGPAGDVIVIGKGKSQLDAYLAKTLRKERRRMSGDPNPEDGHYYRTDHFSFAKRGVPMLYIESGQNLLKGGRRAGRAAAAAYESDHYHAPSDEYDPGWDWSGVMQDLQVYYRTGRMLAESAQWPNWRVGDEFRHIRDESCGASAKGC